MLFYVLYKYWYKKCSDFVHIAQFGCGLPSLIFSRLFFCFCKAVKMPAFPAMCVLVRFYGVSTFKREFILSCPMCVYRRFCGLLWLVCRECADVLPFSLSVACLCGFSLLLCFLFSFRFPPSPVRCYESLKRYSQRPRLAYQFQEIPILGNVLLYTIIQAFTHPARRPLACTFVYNNTLAIC